MLLSIFSYAFGHLYVFFEQRNICSSLIYSLSELSGFLLLSFRKTLHILDINPFSSVQFSRSVVSDSLLTIYIIYKYVLPFCRLPFHSVDSVFFFFECPGCSHYLDLIFGCVISHTQFWCVFESYQKGKVTLPTEPSSPSSWGDFSQVSVVTI